MLLGITTSAFAASEKKTEAKAKTPAKTSSASTGSDNMDHVVDGSLIVTRVGGVGAGLLFGVPVAAVRQSYKWYTTWTPELADHMGGKDFGPSCAAVSVVTLPASLIWGTVTGCYVGGKNGLNKGFTEPFNPSSFSITKDYEE
jgi:hypothetical protein